MENLFSTDIAINGQHVSYRVFFDNEKYFFRPESENKGFPFFSLKREHDEWHDQEMLNPDIREQAIEELEKYLLKQH